eukprot:TRINITY_DN5910_c0_g1_i1.p1 TRINITY_DN5910_c0_g1~~TRINITY_DN5910_c0_g1_i1.p1  ORF type:complete len:102 (-),score=24.47 TRINITY_DN5910_c0_g1_i1:29-334(-)
MTNMFVRVKRMKTTYFLHVEPSETVLEVKQKLQVLSDQPADAQRLFLMPTKQLLEDHRTLGELKVENDAVVALTYKSPDSDSWEAVNIETPKDGRMEMDNR